jgi:hypothetical protein
MKINKILFNTSKFFVLILSLSSCGSELKKYNLTLYSNGQIFDDSIQLNNSKSLTESIPKIIVNDQIYICDDVKFVRIDRFNETSTLTIDHNLANKIKIKMGVELSEEDKLNDIAEASNIHFPSLFSKTNGNSNNTFPSECAILITSIDSLNNSIVNAITNEESLLDLKIGIDTKHSIIQDSSIQNTPVESTKEDQLPNVKIPKETIEPKVNILPSLRINLEISDDQSELKWYNNEKSGSDVKYTIIIYKNNQPIITKSNIHGNKISCLELNNNKLLNVDCEYLIQLKALRKEDNSELTETYDIELTSPTKFNPRCHLNLQND